MPPIDPATAYDWWTKGPILFLAFVAVVGGAYAYKTLVNDIKHDAQGARENTAKTTEVLIEMKATLSKMADTMDRIEYELKARR